MENKKEMVEHPSHYNQGSIEVIDFIEAWKLDFTTANIINVINTIEIIIITFLFFIILSSFLVHFVLESIININFQLPLALLNYVPRRNQFVFFLIQFLQYFSNALLNLLLL